MCFWTWNIDIISKDTIGKLRYWLRVVQQKSVHRIEILSGSEQRHYTLSCLSEWHTDMGVSELMYLDENS